MSCPRCGFENERGAHFCARCGAPQRADAVPAADTVLATLIPERLRLAAGAEGQVALRVRNLAEVVDRYDLRVAGPASAWTAVEPPLIRLLPGEEGEATITLRPPRSSAVASGEVVLEVWVDARAQEGRAVVRVAVEVEPYADVRAVLVPERVRARRHSRHRLTVENRGNAALQAGVSVVDPEQALDIVAPTGVAVSPGQAQAVEVRVLARRSHWWGRPLEHPFTVTVSPPEGDEIARKGTLAQLPVIPLWLLAAAAAAILLLIAISKLTS